ncbi:putative multidrug/chloramphenicol efflux transport protein (MFS superfamily) [Xenorhabdus nematophila ATCC 19061]|uniref:Multidrug/chloramphenicol efflux transport protein (MFS superfamily) n=1 Tax=Xenorhabdus nematophila (strain ATCC 19061 / DSM 3370 / CCUG 14189 / LMG 1036 / NCIMB 9965 / AN6) TaxID=406817 RepID=D3VCV4_XENNA|nr:MFS transporter [Xenorhabdus nematophila]CBJ89820.1 putative multidrug/chloramphenicol efflux transport protein (MFS superfamily) [Xenorhabdus nematophila ATCC 19061]CEK22705.1 putative multidrug/chloramphenicol efflux transport protein (MFS superfamily) [Xenorhabdus nematophila AN6/1]
MNKRKAVAGAGVLAFALFLIICHVGRGLSNDIYLPAMPGMTTFFASSEHLIQFSLSIWFIGAGIPCLFLGPLANRYGRRVVMLGGSVLFIISTLLCVLTNDITFFLAARFMQGMGAAVFTIIGYTAIAEVFSGNMQAKMFAWIAICGTLSPLLGPAVGSAILVAFDWRATFVLVLFLSLVAAMGLFFTMPETRPREQRSPLHLNSVFQQYLSLLTFRPFITSLLTFSLLFAGLIAWLTASPFLLMAHYGMNESQFSLLQIGVFGAYMLASLYSNRRLSVTGTEKIIVMGIALALIGALVMLLSCFGGRIEGILVGMGLFSGGVGYLTGAINAVCLGFVLDRAANASALLGFVLMIISMLASALISAVADKQGFFLAGLLLLISGFSWFIRGNYLQSDGRG